MFFQGAMFIVLPNVPGATFIQGGMFIPDSRVVKCYKDWVVQKPDFEKKKQSNLIRQF